MSDEKQETIEGIVAEMRSNEFDDPRFDKYALWAARRLAKDWADRIEAAWKAERESAEADALVVGGMVEAMRNEKRGNAAKLREAYEFAEEFLRDYGTDWKLHNKLCDMLKSALAAPARNCDVPHKDDHELWLRWQAFCAEIYPSRMSFSTWLLDLAQEGGAK